MILTRSQRTLAGPAVVSGRGYWTGRTTRVEFRPAPVDTGLQFVRDDLDQDAGPIPVSVAFRQPATRRTVLANDSGAEVAMMAAARRSTRCSKGR